MAETAAPGGTQSFTERVLTLFATSIATTAIGIFIGIMLARILGPAGKGDYLLLTLFPTTILILIQLGLPQAFGFYAARGKTLGINTKACVLTLALAVPAIVLAILLLPVLRGTILDLT